MHGYSNELQHHRFGDIVFGDMLVAGTLRFERHDKEIAGCQYINVENHPDVQVMVVDGMITRLDTNATELIKQDSPFYGLATGSMTFKAFKLKHPEIEIEVHEYQNGFYLRWYNKDQSKAIVVDFIQGKIESIKAGLVPEVLFVEGCA